MNNKHSIIQNTGLSRVDSEYYKIVERPIDFSRILQKIKSGEYKSFKEFCADIELLFHNAKLFYKVYLKLNFELRVATKYRIILLSIITYKCFCLYTTLKKKG
jgi:hypothetical protein